MTHDKRPTLDGKLPVHVTWRMLPGVWNLRTQRCKKPIRLAILAASKRAGFRLIHVSLQGNHIHAIIEATSKKALSTGMQSLAIRIAKALNKLMGREGPVFADRYHEHVIKTPQEMANALAYVVGNYQIHRARMGDPLRDRNYQDPYATAIDRPFFEPKTWLPRIGWRKARLKKISPPKI
jgi:REP element-mobilizing transposase RayT